ncbi:MAG: hypothetical protein K2J71_03575 [Oscillospiraceae bacterium]|nr:hypothetical protein [Oscillospiraceae bacterium]
MPNMSKSKTPVPEQNPEVRARNFEEVTLGYTEELALAEASRCLNCPTKPCVSGCPVGVRIPEFIEKITHQDYAGAYEIIHSTNALPAVCGRVCPQERQCESRCVRAKNGEAVGIGRLERFIADLHQDKDQLDAIIKKPDSNHHKIAIVGGGNEAMN